MIGQYKWETVLLFLEHANEATEKISEISKIGRAHV